MKAHASRAVACVAVLLALAACHGSPPSPHPTPKFVAVLVDLTSSTGSDRQIYLDAIDRLVGSVDFGDRILIAPITGASSDDFRAVIDETLPERFPDEDTLRDPHLVWRANAKKAIDGMVDRRAQIKKSIDDLLTQKFEGQRTQIFESLRVVAPIVEADTRRKFLVILSDMQEASPTANFEKTLPTAEFTTSEIARQGKIGTLPDLHGVHILVAGAAAPRPEQAAAIQKFWTQYFEAAKAPLGSGCYARVLNRYDEPKAIDTIE